MNQSAKIYLVALVVLSVLVSSYSFYLGTLDEVMSEQLEVIWFLIFSSLLTLWVVKDPEGHFKSFDGSAWLFLFWPLVLPVYLCQYRGIEGLVLYVGILSLWASYSFLNLYGHWYFA
jgi:hypothetical protein